MVDSLKGVIDTLYTQVNPPQEHRMNPGGGENKENKTYIDLSSQDVILYQNIPNPFSDETTVNYYLPENTGSAKIIFLDQYGRVIKETELTEKGNGSLIINSTNLATGIYSYSIIVNGMVKDTKKMIRGK